MESRSFAATAPTASEELVDLGWVIRARWGLVLAFLVALVLSELGAVQRLAVAPMLTAAGITAVTNGLHPWVRRILSLQAMTVAILVFDTVVLTAVLYATGGAANPLTALYLMPIALAAVMLPARYAWLLAVVTMSMFFLLFLSPESHSHKEAMGHAHDTGVEVMQQMHTMHEAHDSHVIVPNPQPQTIFDLHLRGMWMAFALTAILVAYFVTRVTEALRARERELEEARARTYRAERVASLASLAASTAHELGTPLASIALSASEMRRAIREGKGTDSVAEDADIVCSEVRRCREIIDAMLGAAGETVGESPGGVSAAQVMQEAVEGLPRDQERRVAVSPAPEIDLVVPRRIVVQALQNLLRNALEASAPDGQIQARVDLHNGRVRFTVDDEGPGMDSLTIKKAFEPFVTTKAGRGRGMGLFFTSSVAHRLGGELRLNSEVGRGTSATLEFPPKPPQ